MIKSHTLLNKAFAKAKQEGIPCTKHGMYRTLVRIGLMRKDGEPTTSAVRNGFAKHCVVTQNLFRLCTDKFASRHHLISLQFIDPKLYFHDGKGKLTKREAYRYHIDKIVQMSMKGYHRLFRHNIAIFLKTNKKHRKFMGADPNYFGLDRLAESKGKSVQELVDRVIDITTKEDVQAQHFVNSLSSVPIDYDPDTKQYAVIWSKIIEWQLLPHATKAQADMVHCHFKYNCRQLLESMDKKYTNTIGFNLLQHDLVRAKAVWSAYPLAIKKGKLV